MEAVFPYLADGILLLIFASVVIWAWRVGFARAISGIVAWIAAAILALQFSAPLAQTAYVRFFEERVTQMAVQEIEEKSDAVQVVQVTGDLLAQIPGVAVRAAESVGVDVPALEKKVQFTAPTAQDAAQQIEQNVLEPVIVAALKVLIFLLILLVVSLLLRLVMNPIGGILHKLPVIGTADRALGGVLGILKGAVVVGVLAILMKVLAGVVEGRFAEIVSQSKLIPFIENSPFAGGFFQS